jgi:hypothetical protein
MLYVGVSAWEKLLRDQPEQPHISYVLCSSVDAKKISQTQRHRQGHHSRMLLGALGVSRAAACVSLCFTDA